MVRRQGANRSDMFHAIVGHYVGCGWKAERIFAHLQQHPHGIGERYLRRGSAARGDRTQRRKYAAS